MKQETNGWGDSAVATKYIYEIIHDFLDADLTKQEMEWELSRLMDELAHNYKVDTNKLIGEK
jgi:hypothetical protein